MTTQMRLFLLRLAVYAVVLGVVILIGMIPARSDNGTPSKFWRASDGWQREHTRRVEHRPARRHTHRHKAAKVKAWRVELPRLPAGCIAVVDVVGDRRPGTRAAREQALQSLRQEAAFRFGEVYADAANLQQVYYQCVTTTINNSLTGAIDKARQLVGGDEGLLHRCRISAAVCRAPMEPEKEGAK